MPNEATAGRTGNRRPPCQTALAVDDEFEQLARVSSGSLGLSVTARCWPPIPPGARRYEWIDRREIDFRARQVYTRGSPCGPGDLASFLSR